MSSENNDDSDDVPGEDGVDTKTESGDGADTDGSSDVEETTTADEAGDADDAVGVGADLEGDDGSTGELSETETAIPTAEAETGETHADGDILAAIASFFIPGVGNMINGDTERGGIVLAVYIAWTVLAWGVIVFVIGSIITLVTFGLGAIIQALIAMVLLLPELAIHVVAALDAYQGSDIVDRVVDKVNEYR